MAETGGPENPLPSTSTQVSNHQVGSWWGNLVSVAKNKSAEVFEFMKRDFDEFSSVVKTEAATIANSTACVVKETLQLDNEESAANSVKRSVSSLLGSFKEALSPSPSLDFDEALIIRDGNPVQMTKLQKKLHHLTMNDSTYEDPIDGEESQRFEAWLSVSEEKLNSTERLTKLLSSNPALQDKYTRLVPDKVNHTDFWQRYLFKRAVLEDAEAEIERKFERDKREAEKYPWDKEESSGGKDMELTEEEQIKILNDYENEMNQNVKPDNALGKTAGEKNIRGNKQNGSSSNKQQTEGVEGDNGCLSIKEKKDMVIVSSRSTQMTNDTSQASSSSKASTDGDWEKEFDLDD